MAELRIMSFNLRYAGADDGSRTWKSRRNLVTQAIRSFNPDLLATQEGLDHQVRDVQMDLPDYEMVGVGRDDGRQRGEFVAVFYRRSRFDRRGEGHFWLSETPHVPGSTSEDASLPRMVTWVELDDLQEAEQGTPHRFVLLNTHLDHRSRQARQSGADLIRRQLSSWPGTPVILAGDFNSGEDDAPHRIFAAGDPPLIDSYRSVHPTVTQPEGTRHDYGQRTDGDRIDWILHSTAFTTVAASIDRSVYDGHFPSDHFPVTAVLKRVADEAGQ